MDGKDEFTCILADSVAALAKDISTKEKVEPEDIEALQILQYIVRLNSYRLIGKEEENKEPMNSTSFAAYKESQVYKNIVAEREKEEERTRKLIEEHILNTEKE